MNVKGVGIRENMRNRQNGFTLLEILIAIAILGIVLAMNSTLLEQMIRSTKRQGAIVASQFETSVGLEIMRNDLGNAGYGLTDDFLASANRMVTNNFEDIMGSGNCYIEPDAHADNPAAVAAFNDCPNPPRALVHVNDVGSSNGYLANSDYMVIRSTAVGMGKSANKWTYIDSLKNDGSNASSYVRVWDDCSLDMEPNTCSTSGQDYMIVIRQPVDRSDVADLVIDSTNFKYSPTYSGAILGSGDQAFRPPSPPTGDRYVAYGIDGTDPSMPFNRADYYVRRTADTGAGCAPGTGTLFKAVANQKKGDGGFTAYPIMDCVANMQAVFILDTDGNGILSSLELATPVNFLTTTGDSSGTALNALEIKQRVKEVRIFILAHEGTFDRGYRYSYGSTITVGPSITTGQVVNLTDFQDADHAWDRYRWKVYNLSVKPRSFY